MNPFSFLSFFGGRGRDGLLLFSKRSKHNTNPILQKLSFPFPNTILIAMANTMKDEVKDERQLYLL